MKDLEELFDDVNENLKKIAEFSITSADGDEVSSLHGYEIKGDEVVIEVAIKRVRSWMKEPFYDHEEIRLPLLNVIMFFIKNT